MIRFGFSTDTYDRAGTPTSPDTEPAIDAAELESRMAQFRGDLMQVPPPVSAKKVDGVRAYKLARQNVAFELRAGAGACVRTGAARSRRARWRGCGRIARAEPICAPSRTNWARRWDAGRIWQELRRTASGEFKLEQASTSPNWNSWRRRAGWRKC